MKKTKLSAGNKWDIERPHIFLRLLVNIVCVCVCVRLCASYCAHFLGQHLNNINRQQTK